MNIKSLATIIKRSSIIIFILVCLLVIADRLLLNQKQGGVLHLVESTSQWELYFTATGTTASQLRQQLELQHQQSCVVINGGYFAYTTGGDFQPAGMIWQEPNNDGIITKIRSTVNPMRDPNITTMVHNRGHNEMFMTSVNSVGAGSAVYSFYAGPIVIEQGKILTGDIAGSTHGGGNYYRTFLAYGSGTTYFGVTTQKMTLYQLGQHILGSFPDVYVAVNLDGGPSTSIASAEYSFNAHQKLPRFFYTCNNP